MERRGRVQECEGSGNEGKITWGESRGRRDSWAGWSPRISALGLERMGQKISCFLEPNHCPPLVAWSTWAAYKIFGFQVVRTLGLQEQSGMERVYLIVQRPLISRWEREKTTTLNKAGNRLRTGGNLFVSYGLSKLLVKLCVCVFFFSGCFLSFSSIWGLFRQCADGVMVLQSALASFKLLYQLHSFQVSHSVMPMWCCTQLMGPGSHLKTWLPIPPKLHRTVVTPCVSWNFYYSFYLLLQYVL